LTKTFSDKVLIKRLRESKRYGAIRLLKMFPDRLWNLSGLQKLVRKIDETGSAEQRPGSGRPRNARSSRKIEEVGELALKKASQPQYTTMTNYQNSIPGGPKNVTNFA